MRRQLAVLAAAGALAWALVGPSFPSGEARPSVSGVAAAAAATAPPGDSARTAEVRLAADVRRAEIERERERRARREQILGLSDDGLRTAVRSEAGALGSLSFGRANRGALFNAVQMPQTPLWHLAEPEKAWGTQETIDGLVHAIGRVNEEFVDSPPLWIGHISHQGGGWLRPHRSHQAGRDADVGFYYADGSKWYTKGTAKNLDLPRNWLLLRTLLRETDVEYVFLDRSIQALLADYALATGEEPGWVDQVFAGSERRTTCIVRHEWGHATHMHVRFTSRVSRELAERVHPVLVAEGLMPRATRRR